MNYVSLFVGTGVIFFVVRHPDRVVADVTHQRPARPIVVRGCTVVSCLAH